MGPDTPNALPKQYSCLCDITNSKNKPVVFGRIPKVDSDAIFCKRPANSSKGPRLASDTLFVFVKDEYVGYLSDSDPSVFKNTSGSHSIFHCKMNESSPFIRNQTEALNIHASGA